MLLFAFLSCARVAVIDVVCTRSGTSTIGSGDGTRATTMKSVLKSLCFPFTLFEFIESLAAGFEGILCHLQLYMLLVAIRKQFLDDRGELGILMQGLLPVLFKVLQLEE